MPPTNTPRKLGRFDIVRPLGEGAQGAVYLASDSHLGRQVAIKTLRLQGDASARSDQLKALMAEARIVSQLSHPNIVTLHDAGDEQGLPYLVFEYVEGTLLSDAYSKTKPIEPNRAADISVQILKAIGYAHKRGVLHRDIKPANIILTEDGIARVMDFGIAQLITSDAADKQSFCGTPRYMAPEYIDTKAFSRQSDLFSIGMVFHEMLTGEPVIDGSNVYAILHKIANDAITSPSSKNPNVDEKLDVVVMRALAKNPAERFASAEAMEEALYKYLNPEPMFEESEKSASNGTLEFLIRRMRHKSDFPALSTTIGAVNKAAASEVDGVQALSNSILKDFALTNKLLKLVNTAFYGQFGGSISTISRAVVILGFDKVRTAAVTLLLFEHIQNKGMASQLKDDLVCSYFSGLLARDLSRAGQINVAEEAFICSMFHDLGKLLTRFYFTEESREIDKLIQQRNLDSQHAAYEVLGISFEELGIGVAKHWNFPSKLIESMRRLKADPEQLPKEQVERLRIMSEMSGEITTAIRNTPSHELHGKLKQISLRFGKAVKIDQKTLLATILESVQEIQRDAAILNFSPKDSAFLARASGLNSSDPEAASTKTGIKANPLTETGLPEEIDLSSATVTDNGGRKSILSAGIQDITNSLVGSFQLNDILRMILETMFRGIGFTRVLLCVRDARDNVLRARFGFGESVDEILRRGFAVPLGSSSDIFEVAASKGVDIFIEDINHEKVRNYVPAWYRKLVPSLSISLFPVVVAGKTIGIFYGDSGEAGSLKFSTEELSLLKTLRNQAVLAIRQSTA